MSEYNPFSLVNKTILVTGASSGIGQSIAIECSKMGAQMIVTARNQERLHETVSQIATSGCQEILADISTVEGVDAIVEQIPALDGLVLNAGIIYTTPVKFINEESMMSVFNTNILSSIRLVQRLIKKKKLNRNASIVFISSISTFQVKKGNSLYSATKGAINSFAKAVAIEVSQLGIRVNVIQPGNIKTRVMDAGAITEEQRAEYMKKYILGEGEPIDIAYPTIYLLSNAAKWVTGSIFTIDGGGSLQ
jgi:NAD(P)-dependent dehydrogenase (short-subunit alcohol dehydrogenase family)